MQLCSVADDLLKNVGEVNGNNYASMQFKIKNMQFCWKLIFVTYSAYIQFQYDCNICV